MLMFLTLFVNGLHGQQDYFNLGMQYFESGNYLMADSLLTQQIYEFPDDLNARYNRGVARLYMGDTCDFCHDMYSINSIHDRDQQAMDLYLEYCCDADTALYDRKMNIIEDGKVKYYEVIFFHYCSSTQEGKFYNKKGYFEGMQMAASTGVNSFRTRVFAKYYFDADGEKVFQFTDDNPRFKRSGLSLDEAFAENPYIEKLQSNIGAVDTTFHVIFVVDKSGKAQTPEVYTYNLNQRKQTLIENPSPYFDSLIMSLPEFNPATLRNKMTVKCKVGGFLRF